MYTSTSKKVLNPKIVDHLTVNFIQRLGELRNWIFRNQKLGRNTKNRGSLRYIRPHFTHTHTHKEIGSHFAPQRVGTLYNWEAIHLQSPVITILIFPFCSKDACSVMFLRKQLGKLTYLHMCIKETTRIFAPVPMISRSLDKTYEIDGHHVPEGKYTEQLWKSMIKESLPWVLFSRRVAKGLSFYFQDQSLSQTYGSNFLHSQWIKSKCDHWN